jgi:cell division protein FtsB
MSAKYNLSPTEKLNYVQKGKIKGQGRKFFKQILFSFLILGILTLLAIPYFKNYQKRKDLEIEISKINDDIYKYEKTNEELREFLTYLESDQAIVEKARVNLGLQKEGESVVVIKRNDSGDNLVENEMQEVKTETSNFKKWLNYFFNN